MMIFAVEPRLSPQRVIPLFVQLLLVSVTFWVLLLPASPASWPVLKFPVWMVELVAVKLLTVLVVPFPRPIASQLVTVSEVLLSTMLAATSGTDDSHSSPFTWLVCVPDP